MSKPLQWVKRLTPADDEGLASFLGRWARANRLQSRPRLLQAIDIPKALRIKDADVKKLSVALGVSTEDLQKIAPSDVPAYPALRRGMTRPLDEAVCPQCLEAGAYSRQIWSHRLATACSAHGVRLVDRCGGCGKPIVHDRPLPHLCPCGADLRRIPTVPASIAEVGFAELLMGRRHPNDAFPFAVDCDIPVDVDQFFLGLANHLGGADGSAPRPKAGKADVPSSVDAARARLEGAFRLLSDWPVSFDVRLKQLIELPSAAATTGVVQRLGGWYGLLFRRHRHPMYQPLRVAAANRISLSLDGTLNARTRNVTAIATVTKTWYSVMEAVEELGVSRDRVNDGIDLGLIDARVHDESANYRQRFLNGDEISRLQQLQLDHISDRSAMKALHVTQAIYGLMDEAGWIIRASSESVAPVVTGMVLHVPLLRLMFRLKAVAQAAPSASMAATVPLRDLHLRRTTDRGRLVETYRAILAGELVPVGDDGTPGLGGLLFAAKQIDARVASRLIAKALTVQQISVLTSAHYDAVLGWVKAGLLPATQLVDQHGSPWVVELQDLVRFLMTYCPLAGQAAAAGSSSRGLTSTLEKAGVEVLNPTGPRGALVKVSGLIRSIRSKAAAQAA
jgi:hypothetical protein